MVWKDAESIFQWCFHGRRSCRISRSLLERLSGTWPASIQIIAIKEIVYIRKEFNSHRTPTWPPFYCLGTPTRPKWRPVKTPCKWVKVGGRGEGKFWNNVWLYLTLLFAFDLFTAARCCCWCFFLYVWFSFAKHSIQLLVNLNQCTKKIRKRAKSHLY